MSDKIVFSSLSAPLKFIVVASWLMFIVNVLFFVVGF